MLERTLLGILQNWSQVKIPKDSVGLVIGRQGANIREIQVGYSQLK